MTPQAQSSQSISSTNASRDLPPTHPRTHGIHVATLTLRAHHPSPLTQFAGFALYAAHSLGIPASQPAALPVTRSLYIVLKSPFVHKKAQENFEKKYHGRVIKLWDADREVIDKWLRYLKKYSIGGVGMKAVVHDWTSLDGTSASTSATPNTTSTETVSDKVLKAVGELTAELKEEVASASEAVTEKAKAAASTVKETAGEAAHTVGTLTGVDTLKPEDKSSKAENSSSQQGKQ